MGWSLSDLSALRAPAAAAVARLPPACGDLAVEVLGGAGGDQAFGLGLGGDGLGDAARDAERSARGGEAAARWGPLWAGERSARARAAARNIASVTRRAPEAITPWPRPGRCKSYCTGRSEASARRMDRRPNGLPVATRARPSVQASRSAGVASLREVGFESGKIAGRSTCRAMVRTTSSVNVPGWPEVPIRTVGRACSTTVQRSRLPASRGQPASRVRGAGVALLERREVGQSRSWSRPCRSTSQSRSSSRRAR